MSLEGKINQRFGTWRGMIRLYLAHLEVAAKSACISLEAPTSARRLVFVCHGNICRSAFAEAVASSAGLSATSFGLSTSSGKPAYDQAIKAAHAFGQDLSLHRTTAVEDFLPRPGDVLLAMETRHLRKIAATPKLAAIPRTLLGLYTDPATLHLHDPYGLHENYMDTCLALIASSAEKLTQTFPNARA
jgi:protein-tyrosine phosphatase